MYFIASPDALFIQSSSLIESRRWIIYETPILFNLVKLLHVLTLSSRNVSVILFYKSYCLFKSITSYLIWLKLQNRKQLLPYLDRPNLREFSLGYLAHAHWILQELCLLTIKKLTITVKILTNFLHLIDNF